MALVNHYLEKKLSKKSRKREEERRIYKVIAAVIVKYTSIVVHADFSVDMVATSCHEKVAIMSLSQQPACNDICAYVYFPSACYKNWTCRNFLL